LSRKSELAKNSWGESCEVWGGKFPPKRCLDKTLPSSRPTRGYDLRRFYRSWCRPSNRQNSASYYLVSGIHAFLVNCLCDYDAMMSATHRPLRVQNRVQVQLHPGMLVETTHVTEFEYYFACTRKGVHAVHLYSVTSPGKMIFAVL